MTYKPPFGIWTTAKSFGDGDSPVMVCENSRTFATETVRDGMYHENLPQRVLIASLTKNGTEWLPMGFLTPDTYEPMSAKQRPKYVLARKRNLEPAQGVPETVEEIAPLKPQEFILRVEPNLAAILRDAFTLVGEGHQVRVMLTDPAATPAPEAEPGPPVEIEG